MWDESGVCRFDISAWLYITQFRIHEIFSSCSSLFRPSVTFLRSQETPSPEIASHFVKLAMTMLRLKCWSILNWIKSETVDLRHGWVCFTNYWRVVSFTMFMFLSGNDDWIKRSNYFTGSLQIFDPWTLQTVRGL